MRKFIDIINESQEVQNAVNKIADFLHTLATDEVGVEEIDGYTVRFEGFSDMCWESAEEQGKTIEGLEQEMIKDWQGRHPGMKLVASGWIGEGEYWTDSMFYAVFRPATGMVTEGVDSVFVPVENEYYDDTAEVFRNPSRALFNKQIRESKHARGFLDVEKKEFWVWFAGALHSDIDHERIGGSVWLTWDEPRLGDVLIQYDAESMEMIDPDAPDFDQQVEKLIMSVRPFVRVIEGQYTPRFDHR